MSFIVKKENKLPNVLSKNEIKRIFEVTNNLKHKCNLMLIYSASLRRSELLNLTFSDIDSERMVTIFMKQRVKKIEYPYFLTICYNY